MPSQTAVHEEWEAFRLSLVRDDFLYRLQRRIGLIPAHGSGVVRRAVFWTTVTWLPLAIWATVNGRIVAGEVPEALLQHLSVHARLLIGIPAFHLAEVLAGQVLDALLPYLARSGVVPEASLPTYRDVLRGIAKLRSRTLPWVVVMAIALGSVAYLAQSAGVEELAWARDPDGGLGFGAWWLLVGRVVFVVLLAAWLWRLVLLFLLFRRLSAIGLALAPTHADRAAGLGFLERVPTMFGPVVAGVSSVVAAHWGHLVLYHGVHVAELRNLMIALALILVFLFLTPNLAFGPLLRRTKRAALYQYGTLVRQQGRLVHERWVEEKPTETDGLLNAPELGPIADLNAAYEAIARMRTIPIGLPSVAAVLVPALIPMLPVLAIEVPIKELLKGLAKALM